MSLQLKRFDPTKIKDDKVCLFIGKRGTGKSTLVTDILYYKRNMPSGVVMSGTEDGNHYYSQYIPDLFIYGNYNKETIENIIAKQRSNMNLYGKSNPVFILLDDCMFDKSFMRDECIRQLFMNGRHWNIFFMLTAQYCMDLPPGLRSNVDYVFVLRENVIQNRERLYKSFFGVFPSFSMFQSVMDACTENYECLVLDNTSKSNKLNECVYYYKAAIRPPFRIGGEAMWSAHKRFYNPKHGTKQTDPKKKASGFVVQKV
jgi:energy-coupling factor transporter ATP-binding protein EcfA2